MTLPAHQIVIRKEGPGDAAAVRAVNDLAFGQPDEGRLVDALRDSSLLSLVAVDGDQIVGHALFTRVRVERGRAGWTAAALGPMAVQPDRQGLGVGSSLVRDGLARLGRMNEAVVFVLGHPGYYPRFGFRPAAPLGLRCEWDVPEDVFMVAELREHALAGRQGLVRYDPAFHLPR